MLIRSKDNMSIQERLQGFFNESVSVSRSSSCSSPGCGRYWQPVSSEARRQGQCWIKMFETPPLLPYSPPESHPSRPSLVHPNRYSIECATSRRNCWRRCIRYALITVPSTWTLMPTTEQYSRLRSRWVSFVDVPPRFGPALPCPVPPASFAAHILVAPQPPLRWQFNQWSFCVRNFSWAFVVFAYLDGSLDSCQLVYSYTGRKLVVKGSPFLKSLTGVLEVFNLEYHVILPRFLLEISL